MKATWTEQAKSMLWNSINGAINRGMSLYFERVAEKGQKRDAERERESFTANAVMQAMSQKWGTNSSFIGPKSYPSL